MNLHLALRDDLDGCRPVPTDAGLLCLRIKHLKPNKTCFHHLVCVYLHTNTSLHGREEENTSRVHFTSAARICACARKPHGAAPSITHTHTHSTTVVIHKRWLEKKRLRSSSFIVSAHHKT